MTSINRYDWSVRTIHLYKKLTEASGSMAALEALRPELVKLEPTSDLELLFEYAVCANSPMLVHFVSSVMKERRVELHIESIMRIALWPADKDKRLSLTYPFLKELCPVARPNADKLTLAILDTASSPDAFIRMLRMCPNDMMMSDRAINAIVSVCYAADMVQAVSNSWLDDVSPGCWGIAPKPKKHTAESIGNLILCAKLSYTSERTDVMHLATNVSAYWSQKTPPAGQTEAESDGVPLTDALPEGPHHPPIHTTMNQFLRAAAKSGRKPFGPVKACNDPAHLMCAILTKK